MKTCYAEIAKDYKLWQEYVDPSGLDSEDEFNAKSHSEKIEFIKACFGPDQTPILTEDNEWEGGACPKCNESARLLTCCACGRSAWIINCGHYDQPRPIAPGRADGTELHNTYCEDCANEN